MCWGLFILPQKVVKRGLVDVKWGEVYYADLPIKEHSCVQGGCRPVVVVQNNIGNRYSSTVLIAPMTSCQKKMQQPTHVPVDCLKLPSIILCEQMQTIDKHQLKNRVGNIPKDIMTQVIRAINVQCSEELAAC
jgi:mRNA interferase MazF